MELLSAGRLILLVLSVSQDHIKLKQKWKHWLCVQMLRIFVHWAVSNLLYTLCLTKAFARQPRILFLSN